MQYNYIEESEIDKYYAEYNKANIIESEMDFFILLEGLNYDEKMAITLYYLKDFKNEDISKILNVPTSTIKNRIARARKKIKKRIGEMYNGII